METSRCDPPDFLLSIFVNLSCRCTTVHMVVNVPTVVNGCLVADMDMSGGITWDSSVAGVYTQTRDMHEHVLA